MNYTLDLEDQLELLDEPAEISLDSALSVFMIGHSNHTFEKFAGLLARHGVTLIVDVRSSPNSRFSPHFSQKRLKPALREIGVLYHHEPLLGGRDPVPLTEQRRVLRAQAPFDHGTCFMCSEGKYVECHRHWTLTPLLRELGVPVQQILPDGSLHEDTGPTEQLLRKVTAFLPSAR